MSRLFQPAQRRCGWLAFATFAVSGLLVSSAGANEIAFGVGSIYNGAPDAGSNLVFYNLPTTGPYAGAVNSYFDLRAFVNPNTGTETASGFGLIARLSGTGEVVFNPPVVGDEENNLTPAMNPTTTKNNSFDILYATTGVQTGNSREIDVIGIEEVALQNNLVTNGDGLASLPIQIGAGVTGTYNVTFDLPNPGSTDFTGFVKTISSSETQFLTNPTVHPHVVGTIEVRQSRVGDLDGSGAIDSFDISPFVQALGSPAEYKSARPWLQVDYIADIDQGGSIDSFDIQPFVQLLGQQGSPAAIPEPGSVVLALCGFAGLLAANRRWNRKERDLAQR
jgi:hypothetical protein